MPAAPLPPDESNRLAVLGSCRILDTSVAGAVPFAGDNEMEIVAGILSRPAPELSDAVAGIPYELGTLVSRCLSRAKEDRPSSMGKLTEELRAIVQRA